MNKHLLQSLADQAEASASTGGGRKALRQWIEANIAHPRNDNQGWSWRHHEYQIGIVEDSHPWVAVQKPAQCGISELAVCMTLGLLSVLPNSNIIYALQSKSYAQKFAATRFDPAIDRSKKLQALRNKEVNSTELKQIGSSYLHLGGTHSESSAISIPASALIIDEVSFSSPKVLGTYMSRLEHLPEEEKILIQFSTPLFSGMGVSEIFDKGTQHVYMVYHDACGQWIAIDPKYDYIVPGLDDTLDKLEAGDLERYDVDNAFVKCNHCNHKITQENLADPNRRAWVPRFQERLNKIGVPHTYQVLPTDVSGIKSIQQIIRSISLYKTSERFWQYGIGLPYDSLGGQIQLDKAMDCFQIEEVKPEQGKSLYGCVFGMDIGKTSHFMVGRKVGKQLYVVRMETIKQGFEGELQNTVHTRFLQYNCVKGVSDSQPDFSAVKEVQGRLPENAVYGAYFVRSAAGTMNPYVVKDKEGLVAIVRTKALDALIDDFNKGNILLPKLHKEEDRMEVVRHLMAVKRVSGDSDFGEEGGKYVKLTGNDHWLFALLYLHTAANMVENDSSTVVLPAVAGMMGRVPLRYVAA